MPNWKKLIVSGEHAAVNSLNLASVVNAGIDTDKFLVLDSSNNVDFRTGAEVRSDIGAGTGNGTVTGTGTNNQVTTWNGSTSLDGSSNFTYDGTTLTIGTRVNIGSTNSLSGNCTSILGGYNNTIGSNANCSSIASGASNTVNGYKSFIGGGAYSIIDGDESVIVGGANNYIKYCENFIGGGCYNHIGTSTNCSDRASVIVGGALNTVFGGSSGGIGTCKANFIGAGISNRIQYSDCAVLVGGCSNCVTGGTYSFLGGGFDNYVASKCSVVVGGSNNTAYACLSAILGGANNTINHNCSFIAGQSITTDKSNYFFVNNLDASGNIIGNTLSLTGLSAQNSEATAVMINGSNVVGTRELGSNAFNSTAFTTCIGDITQVCITAGDGLTGDVNTTSGNHLQTIDVDSTVVRTSGGQTIGGNKIITGQTQFGSTVTFSDPVTFDSDVTLDGIGAMTESTALVMNGANEVGFRTLGSNAFNSTAFTTCTGTTTPSNTQTFTNKSGNISQWTNDSGYITDGNTNWNNSYGFTTCTGTVTSVTAGAGMTQTGTSTVNPTLNVIGGTAITVNANNIEVTAACNTAWNAKTTCTGTLTGTGADNRVATWSGTNSLDSNSAFTYDGTTLTVGTRANIGGTNSLSGNYTSILGGYFNTIGSNAHCSTIAGGNKGTINGYQSFIGGGGCSVIEGNQSVIVGGCNNYIKYCANFIGGGCLNYIGSSTNCSDCASVIVGGALNYICGGVNGSVGSCQNNFIGGGYVNSIIYSDRAAIVGGYSNCLSGAQYSFLGGGYNNAVNNKCSVVVGGSINTNYSSTSFIGGGSYNTIYAGTNNSSITAGYNNTLSGYLYNSIGAGRLNYIGVGSFGEGNRIGGGGCNCICGTNVGYSTISGGQCNKLCNTHCSFIGGGASNCIISQNCSFIGGGGCNYVCGRASTITGGECNYICNGICRASSILGGCNNKICTAEFALAFGLGNVVSHDRSHAIGIGLFSTTTDTTYMNNATVACHLQVGGTTTLNSTTGRIDATNDIVAYATSDRRLKENIQPINDALCKVIGVSGNTFDWKPLTEEETQTIHGNTGRDVGVIAQEIESILPEAVTTRDNGYKAVNYEKIVPLLIEAIKEQQKQIDELKSKV